MADEISRRRANLEVVYGSKIDSDGSSGYFTTDQPLGTQPTLSMTLTPSTAKRFMLESVRFYMNPTAAVTYQLLLSERSSSDTVTSYGDIVFDSGAGMADDTIYIVSRGDKLPHLVVLSTAATLYYQIDWSGAPGDTSGYILIRGRNMY